MILSYLWIFYEPNVSRMNSFYVFNCLATNQNLLYGLPRTSFNKKERLDARQILKVIYKRELAKEIKSCRDFFLPVSILDPFLIVKVHAKFTKPKKYLVIDGVRGFKRVIWTILDLTSITTSRSITMCMREPVLRDIKAFDLQVIAINNGWYKMLDIS